MPRVFILIASAIACSGQTTCGDMRHFYKNAECCDADMQDSVVCPKCAFSGTYTASSEDSKAIWGNGVSFSESKIWSRLVIQASDSPFYALTVQRQIASNLTYYCHYKMSQDLECLPKQEEDKPFRTATLSLQHHGCCLIELTYKNRADNIHAVNFYNKTNC